MSILAGAAMSFQGVINTRLSEKIGLYESNVFAQATGLIFGIIALFFAGKGDFSQLGSVNKIYLIGGLLGTVITVTVMLAIGNLSPAVAISIILVSQLLVAAIIEAFGWLGSEQISFGWTKWIGLVLMIVGVVTFKYKS